MQEQTIFIEALERGDPTDRAAFLDRVCASDQALKERIEKLLRRHHQTGSFLDSPALGPTTPRDEPLLVEGPGTVIGPYKLLEPIGEGGMGVVYMAEQTHPVRRKVALKIIKPGMDTKQVIARFEAERQALALMDHPNIARVLDAGATESGRPYFVMELVRGVPITDYCDQNHLGLDDRLDLFVLVCQAVQHAHQKGIIHRDIKPSNVMVTLHDGVPVPRVIDFGIAKATGQSLTDKTLFTGLAQLIGTPLYMSPEQAEMSGLNVDTRSDIYSLGVLLYEILTGTTPFDPDIFRKAAVDEVRRMFREDEPPRPSARLSTLDETKRSTVSVNRRSDARSLGRVVKGELDWIVMKALEKDRRRRYETANDFAADVMRYVTDRPVEACPPSTWYRFRKFARRNRVALITGGAMALALVLGVVVSTWQATRAMQAKRAAVAQSKRATAAEQEATQERDEVRRQRQRAEANFRKARDAVDRMFKRAAQDLVDVPHMEQVRRALLEDALEFYQGFLKEKSTDPDVTHETARAYMQVGILYHNLGRSDQVEKPLSQAIALLEGLSRKFPTVPEYRLDLAECYGQLAFLDFWALRTQQSIEGRRKELALHERLAAEFPTVPAYARALAMAHSSLATAMQHGGKTHPEEEEEHHRKALAVWRKYQEDFPKLPKDRAGEAHLRHWWGASLMDSGRLQEAEAEYRKAVALREQLVAEAPTPNARAGLEHIKSYLGRLLVLTGSPEKAEPFLRQAIKIGEQLRDDFPHIPDHRVRLGNDYLFLHQALLAMGHIQEAEEAVRRSLAIHKALVDEYPGVQPHPEMLSWGYNYLGTLLHSTGRAEEEAGAFRQALEIREKLLIEFPDNPPTLIGLADILTFCPAPQFRDEARAVALFKRVVQRAPTDGRSWFHLGVALYRTGAWEGAVEALNKSVNLGIPIPAKAPLSRFFLAMAHWRKGEKDQARTWYDKAIASMKENPRPKDELVRHIRIEAAALLGLETPPVPKTEGKDGPPGP